MNELNETLKRALALAREKPAEALSLLEAGLRKARISRDWRGVSTLAKHAGLVSTGSGDFLRAIKYYDEALSADPADPYLHFARGDVYKTLGQNEQARLAFTQSLNLATEQGNVDMIKISSEELARLQ